MKIRYVCSKWPETILKPNQLLKIRKSLAAHFSIPDLTIDIGIAFVSNAQSQKLNATYRKKNKPTNVLSFAQFNAKQLHKKTGAILYLGDLALCLPVIRKEAKAQKKPLTHHILHLIVHGTLHLLGYDHENDSHARRMEKTEIQILAACAVPNPYAPIAQTTLRNKNKK